MLEILTPPLILRPLRETDQQAMHAVWTDAHVRRYLLDDTIVPQEWTRQEIINSMDLFTRAGHGLWSVRLENSPGHILGFTGYRNFYDPPELQLIYGVLPEYCNRGFSTKLARTMIQYGFQKCNMESVVACADLPNAASIRVMEKAGMHFLKEMTINEHPLVYYSISKRAWQLQQD